MFSIVITIVISLLVIVGATVALQREISSVESFVIILVVWAVTVMVQKTLARRGGRA